VVFVTPNLASAKSPDDILNNRLAGVAAGISFLVIALGLGGGALAIFRIYLRRR
jgi:hypothetical protein